MEFFKYIWLFIVFNVFTIRAEVATHWMVTESGLIEPKHHSPFNMDRPYDLLALIDQEKRWSTIFNIYHDLVTRQVRVNKLWADLDRETDLEPYLSQNEHCVKAGNLNMFDWYISFLDEGSLKNIPEPKHLMSNPQSGSTYDIPDCKKISSLIFSMFTFEHLESVKQRNNLTVHPDLTLIESPQTLDLFGHWLYGLLRQNTSSWLHYDMAVIYWRIKGNAPKAMECSRRAVHYVPREHKDLALLNMGNILHQSRMTEDAIVILNAAVDHNPQSYMSHFSLANAYAVTGNYNLSLYHFNQSQKINPQSESKFRYIPCILCHASLTPKIDNIKKTLELLRKELHDYNQKETAWPKIQREFLKTIKHSEEFDIRSADKCCERMSQIIKKDVKDLKKHGDKYYLMKYFLDDPLYCGKWENTQGVLAVDAVYSLQRLIRHIEKNVNMYPDTIIKLEHMHMDNDLKQCSDKSSKDKKMGSNCNISNKQQNEADKKISEYETGIFMYPPTMKINRNTEDFDIENEWPNDEFCKESNFPDNIEALYPVFLPFENKGIRLGALLTDKIGVPLWEEHELPWHPPTCPHDKEAAAYTQKKLPKQAPLAEVVHDGYLRKKLLEYVSNDNPALMKNMQDVEIGQRIYSATQKKVAPKWMLLVLSSLYWRVRGNNANALHCLLAAKSVPPRYKDIVLVSLASVFLELGHLDEGIAAAEEAFKLSLYEPATNFLLAEINMLKKHRSTRLFHLKQVVRVEHTFMGGLARRLLDGWACYMRQLHTQQENDFRDSEICTQVEPGVNVVCEKGGDSCYITNIKCRDSNADVGGLLRKLDNSNDLREPGFISDNYFDWLLVAHGDKTASADKTEPNDNTVPTKRMGSAQSFGFDKAAHTRHFEALMKVVGQLKGCGPKGCKSLTPADLSLKEEDCSFYRVQFGYWIQNIKDIVEADMGIIAEINAITTTGKKIPDCRPVDAADDFYLERLSRLDVDGWEPYTTIARQFAEIFNIYDYVSLGSKIARYVETRSRSWAGALFASWWCGVAGRGECARRCVSAAHALAPPHRAHLALRLMVLLLHLQSKLEDAKEMAYLSFYSAPKSKIEAFLAAVSHSHLEEYEQAIWMYRYALKLDDQYLAAKACLHGTICLMLYQTDDKH